MKGRGITGKRLPLQLNNSSFLTLRELPDMQLYPGVPRLADMDIPNSIRFSLIAMASFWPAALSATSPEYLALVDSADNYIKQERWMEAESTIISALRLEPANYTNALLFSNLGVVRTEQGKYKDAIDAFNLGLSITPESKDLLNNRARAKMLLDDFDNAISDLSESLAIDSIQEWALQMRGLLRISRNDLPGARHDLLLLAKNFHKNCQAFSGLARISELEGKYDDALKYYDESIYINDDPDIRSARILLKIKADRYSEAAADIRESIAVYPENPYLYIWRGYLHRLNYRNEEAEADKKIALNKGADPQFVEQFIPGNGR